MSHICINQTEKEKGGGVQLRISVRHCSKVNFVVILLCLSVLESINLCLKRIRPRLKCFESLIFFQNRNSFVRFLGFENLNNFGVKLHLTFR